MLEAARAALQTVRDREPADSRHRQQGGDVQVGARRCWPLAGAAAAGFRAPLSPQLHCLGPPTALQHPAVPGTPPQARTTETASSDGGAKASSSGGGPSRGLTAFVWESDLAGEEEEEEGLGGNGGGYSRDYAPPPGATAAWDSGSSSSGGGGGGGGQSWSQAGLDSWFGDKVDTGPLQLRTTMAPMRAASQVGLAAADCCLLCGRQHTLLPARAAAACLPLP